MRVAPVALVLVLALSVVGWWVPRDDTPNLGERLQAPTAAHPAGTDQLGRDVLARTLRATALAAATALPAWAVAITFGWLVGVFGAVAGRHALGATVRWAIQAMFATPFLLVLIGLGIVLGRGPTTVMCIIVLVCWAPPARLALTLAHDALSAPFTTAARSFGYGPLQIGVYVLAPTCLRPVVIASGGLLADVLAIDATLTLFGLGPTPPSPTMGSMIADGLRFVSTAPWMVGVPLLVLCTLCLGLRWLLHDPPREIFSALSH